MSDSAYVVGLDEALRASEDDPILFEESVKEDFHNLLESIVADARNNLQNNMSVVTGELLGSIKILYEQGYEGVVGTDSEYAHFVEFGRGPVRPVNAKVLHWKD